MKIVIGFANMLIKIELKKKITMVLESDRNFDFICSKIMKRVLRHF